MEPHVLTEVVARMSEDRDSEVTTAFDALLTGPFPDGLLRTDLIRGPEDQWRIQTMWRDKAALDAMRSSGETPAAMRFFIDLGVVPALNIYAVPRSHQC